MHTHICIHIYVYIHYWSGPPLLLLLPAGFEAATDEEVVVDRYHLAGRRRVRDGPRVRDVSLVVFPLRTTQRKVPNKLGHCKVPCDMIPDVCVMLPCARCVHV